jgi:protein SCO1/2
VKALCSLVIIAGALSLGSSARGAPPSGVDDERSVYQLQSRWTTDRGRSVALAELAGHYQIVAFIFTHCADACPLLVKSLQAQSRSMPPRVQQRIRFLLVSMDPQRDTVTALRNYRKDLSLDARWTLLRGNDGDVRELAAVLGFNYDRNADGQFAHANLVTLLNPSGAIVMQHPTAENALSTMSAVIGTCDDVSATRPHIAGKDCR